MDKQILMRRFNAEPARMLLFSKVLDRFFLCVKQGECTFTEFYDPINAAAFAGAFDAPCEAVVRAFGGAPDCERKMLGFAPEGEDLPDSAFPIERLRVSFNTKFHQAPRHQDLLGAVLGLGIDRSRVGDIRLFDGYADMFVHTEISGYILTQLEKAGRTPVTLSRVGASDEPAPLPAVEKSLTVASLRLDAIIAAAFRLSRGQAAALIAGDKVFVNWSPAHQPDRNVHEKDTISVRGQGRVQIAEIEGKTKKDRIRLRLMLG